MDREEFAQRLSERMAADDTSTPAAVVEDEPAAESETEPVEDVVEEEEAPEPEAEEPEEEPEEEGLLAGKYKTQEDLETAYLELQNKLGSQGQELGGTRTEVEALRDELRQLRTALESSPQEGFPVTTELLEWADEAAVENPQEAAMWALTNQPEIYDRILDGWYDHDPGSARRFERTMMMSAIREEMSESLKPVMAPLQQASVSTTFTRAWQDVQTRFPDLPKFADQIIEEAKVAPEITSVFQGGDIKAQARVIETLLHAARGRNADTLVNERLQAERKAQAKGRARKTDATVATSSQAPIRDVVDSDLAEFRREFRKAAGLEGVIPE